MRKRPTRIVTVRFAGPLLAAIVIATSAQTPPPAPAVVLTYASPSYAFAATCDVAQPLVSINVTATNHGNTPASFAVVAIDQRGTLGGGTSVPAVAPGATVAVTIPLRRVGAVVPASLTGTHVIDVSVRALGARPIELQLPFPPALCPPSGSISSRVTRPPVATAPPGFVTSGSISAKRNVSALVLIIAPPANLRSVAAGTDCAAHVGPLGALVCPDMMKSGNLLLIWDWQAGTGLDAIDGYRIYRVGHGAGNRREADQLVATQTNKLQTLFDLPKPRGLSSYDGLCYAVTAYAGTKESARSSAFCAKSSSAATTIQLGPLHQRHSYRLQRQGGAYGPADTEPSRLYVGFVYRDEKHVLGDASVNVIYRGAVAFDVSAVRNRRLVSAHLRLSIQSSEGAGDQHSCTTDIGSGVEAWWLTDRWIEGQFAQSVAPTDLGPNVTTDVTPIVAAWMRGEPNFGFVLKNSDENLAAFTNKSCLTKYAAPTLEVVYY
jgi:hypothetical protein